MSALRLLARRLSAAAGLVFLVAFALLNCSQAQDQETFVIQNQSNKVYSGLDIATTANSGLDCIQIIDSTNITIENSQIGPCGGNGIDIYNNTGTTSNIQIYDMELLAWLFNESPVKDEWSSTTGGARTRAISTAAIGPRNTRLA